MEVNGQQIMLLYDGKIPGSKELADREISESRPGGSLSISKVSIPSLSIFLPEKGKANGTSIVICPGGGYQHVAFKHEGTDIAKLLNQWGITAFVLKYRLPDDSTMVNKSIGPLQDLQMAFRFVREHVNDYKIDVNKVGVMGFSAGGHLASSGGTHFKSSILPFKDSVNLRPDFMVLVYPVISFTDSIGHIGSRNSLIGKNPSSNDIKKFSNEMQVTEQTPPTFLVHAGDDKTVPVQNSIIFYEALHKFNILASLNIYQKGGHGFGLNNHTTDDQWTERLKFWLKENKWIR